MYLFVENDTQYSLPFVWFLAEKRSIHEIATLVQSKQLSIKNIKQKGNDLLVRLLNSDDYTFSPYKNYFLHLKATGSGNAEIKIVFERGDYVSRLWRMPTEHISKETWDLLFPPVVVRPYKMVLADDNILGLRPQKYKKVYLDEEPKLQAIEVYPESVSETAEFGPDKEFEPPSPDLPTPRDTPTGDELDSDSEYEFGSDESTDYHEEPAESQAGWTLVKKSNYSQEYQTW